MVNRQPLAEVDYNLFMDSYTAQRGCWSKIQLPLLGFWILVVTLLLQGVTWTLEQAYFSGIRPPLDPRFLIGLMGGLAIALPALLLWRSAPAGEGGMARAWTLAGILVALISPARLLALTDSQGVQTVQLAALAIFCLALSRVKPPSTAISDSADARESGFPWAWGAGMGALLLLPWVAWGALGSLVDVLLGVGVAGLAGYAAAWLLRDGMAAVRRTGRGVGGWILFGAPLTMMILAFALGLNGNEWLLLLVFPPLGWFSWGLRGKTPAAPLQGGLVLLLTLGLSGALLWVDPDELALIVTLGQGELIEWAIKAALTSLAISLGAALFSGLLRPKMTAPWRNRSAAAVAVAAWMAVGLVYGVWGQPGLYGEELFVILNQQVDLSAPAQISDVALRRAAVYRTLVETANRSQAGLRQTLGQWGIAYRPYYLVNAIEVQGGPLLKAWLLARPEVDRVLASPHLRPLPAPLPVAQANQQQPASPQWNLTMVRANQVWDELGITGEGIVVGQSDSGVEGSHPELTAQYRGSDGEDDGSWLDPWFHTAHPVDLGGHGTHTLGSILGKTVGVAPGAQWIGCVNLARNLANPALYLTCMQFMLAPFPQAGDAFTDGQPQRGAQVLNNSWGCPNVEGCDPGTFLPAVQALEAAGVFVVASAGNDGDSGCGSVRDPIAIYAEVFSVGAVNRQKQRASFSSLGPVTVDGSRRSKPDLAAPGDDVLSAFPNHSYALLSGTSMAGPHVVGTVALMWSANPALIGNIEETRRILTLSAASYTGNVAACGPTGQAIRENVGYGIVDAYAAVKMALAEK